MAGRGLGEDGGAQGEPSKRHATGSFPVNYFIN